MSWFDFIVHIVTTTSTIYFIACLSGPYMNKKSKADSVLSLFSMFVVSEYMYFSTQSPIYCAEWFPLYCFPWPCRFISFTCLLRLLLSLLRLVLFIHLSIASITFLALHVYFFHLFTELVAFLLSVCLLPSPVYCDDCYLCLCKLISCFPCPCALTYFIFLYRLLLSLSL